MIQDPQGNEWDYLVASHNRTETTKNLLALQQGSLRRPELLTRFRQQLIEQEFRPELPSKKLMFARWLAWQGKISG